MVIPLNSHKEVQTGWYQDIHSLSQNCIDYLLRCIFLINNRQKRWPSKKIKGKRCICVILGHQRFYHTVLSKCLTDKCHSLRLTSSKHGCIDQVRAHYCGFNAFLLQDKKLQSNRLSKSHSCEFAGTVVCQSQMMDFYIHFHYVYIGFNLAAFIVFVHLN